MTNLVKAVIGGQVEQQEGRGLILWPFARRRRRKAMNKNVIDEEKGNLQLMFTRRREHQ